MNQRAAGIRNGSTLPTHHAGSTAVSGGETRHSPGPVPCGNGYGVPAGSRPSCSRAPQHRRRAGLTGGDPARLCPTVRDRRQRDVVVTLQRRPAAPGTTPPARGTPRSPRPRPSRPSARRRHAQIRPMTAVDRVHRVIDRPMYHREAQRRGVRRRPGCEDRALRVQVPVEHRVRARARGHRQDRGQRQQRQQRRSAPRHRSP